MSNTIDPGTSYPICPEVTWLGPVQDGIMFATNCFDRSAIDQLHLLASDMTAEKVGDEGQTISGVNSYKKSWDFSLSASDWDTSSGTMWTKEALLEVGYDIEKLEGAIYNGIVHLIEAYTAQWPEIAKVGLLDTGYQVQTYLEGEGYYRPHTDSLPGDPNSLHRVLAVVIYLNSLGLGGDTVFPRHGTSVSPEAGGALVFPASWLHVHESTVPEDGDKHIISTFVCARADEPTHMNQ